MLYNFGTYQNCCYVCGTDGVISVEKSGHKPLCPDCSGKGWPQSAFKTTKVNKFDESKRDRQGKVEVRSFIGTLLQKQHMPVPSKYVYACI